MGPIPSSFWRFALIGAGGLLVDIAALYLCIGALGMNRLLARIPSYIAAATFTWAMNRWLTFGPSGRPIYAEWASFLATNLVGQAVNLAMYAAVVFVMPDAWWTPGAGAIVGSLSGLVFNYLVSRNVVFSRSA